MRWPKILVAAVLASVLAANFSLGKEPNVRVVAVGGDVKVLKKDTAGWITAEAGMELSNGDRVKSSVNSYAEVSFDRKNENLIRIEENTDVYIRLKENEKIELIKGELLSHIKSIPKGRRFEIRTPVAICGARGTGWGVIHNPRTVVMGFEKMSYVKGIDKDGEVMDEEYTVNQGFKRSVDKNKAPSEMEKLSKSDYDKWNAWKEERLTRKKPTRRQKMLQESLEKALERKEEIYEKSDRERIEEKKQERTEDEGQY